MVRMTESRKKRGGGYEKQSKGVAFTVAQIGFIPSNIVVALSISQRSCSTSYTALYYVCTQAKRTYRTRAGPYIAITSSVCP